MSLLEDAKKSLGELFIMGFNGKELSSETEAFISQAGIGGVILFTPNYQSPEQVQNLISSIQDCRHDLPLWVSVDYEGGKVQRFKDPFTKIPEAAVLSETNSPKLIFEISEMMAREIKAVGANINFAPVTDINSNPQNPVIGRRAFGTTEEMVSKFTTAFVRGHISAGVHPCAKHFPGHGDTTVDSHFALPKVEDTLESLQNREFKPFAKAFKSGCRFVMTAHMMNPHLDAKMPATLSQNVLIGILREQMGYTGLIVSDDLEMKAITDHFGAEEAPRLAIEAGCDLLIYRTEAATRHAYTSLLKALDDGTLSPERVLDAADRSRELKKATLMPYQAPTPEDLKIIGSPDHKKMLP